MSFRVPFVLIAGVLLAACAPAIPPRPTLDPSEVEIRVAHVRGQAELAEPAQDVVALEWTYIEDVLALGLQPVAVADIQGYNEYVNIPIELSPEVVDVGQRGSPNLETLASLNPDLIIEIEYSAAGYYDKLVNIAPTVVFNPYPNDPDLSTYEEMRETFMTIAEATGRSAQGEAVLASLDAKIEAGRAAIEAAGASGERFVLAQMYTWENTAYLRFFTDNGMAVEIVEMLGLDNGWDDGFQAYGFTDVGAEALASLPEDIHYFYVLQDEDPMQASTSSFRELWNSLPFVQQGHAYSLGEDTWLFGGPMSAELLVDIVVEAFTGQPLDD